ncbi:hypothetical protein QBC34DRAFT_455194 [Podospora aff. communis PSN243]|uniref:Uncharacterized protein n=1 Tax=Podospora aff. communis PSN243 TaxID=3040156 RepID=A0AAV9G261_9PEZI|nr:hypothetical protein QBC34DRAFT_455194 [Podospora aff. communis PSN243]
MASQTLHSPGLAEDQYKYPKENHTAWVTSYHPIETEPASVSLAPRSHIQRLGIANTIAISLGFLVSALFVIFIVFLWAYSPGIVGVSFHTDQYGQQPAFWRQIVLRGGGIHHRLLGSLDTSSALLLCTSCIDGDRNALRARATSVAVFQSVLRTTGKLPLAMQALWIIHVVAQRTWYNFAPQFEVGDTAEFTVFGEQILPRRWAGVVAVLVVVVVHNLVVALLPGAFLMGRNKAAMVGNLWDGFGQVAGRALTLLNSQGLDSRTSTPVLATKPGRLLRSVSPKIPGCIPPAAANRWKSYELEDLPSHIYSPLCSLPVFCQVRIAAMNHPPDSMSKLCGKPADDSQEQTGTGRLDFDVSKPDHFAALEVNSISGQGSLSQAQSFHFKSSNNLSSAEVYANIISHL